MGIFRIITHPCGGFLRLHLERLKAYATAAVPMPVGRISRLRHEEEVRCAGGSPVRVCMAMGILKYSQDVASTGVGKCHFSGILNLTFKYGGFLKIGVPPNSQMVGWEWKIPSRNGWELGVPLFWETFKGLLEIVSNLVGWCLKWDMNAKPHPPWRG